MDYLTFLIQCYYLVPNLSRLPNKLPWNWCTCVCFQWCQLWKPLWIGGGCVQKSWAKHQDCVWWTLWYIFFLFFFFKRGANKQDRGMCGTFQSVLLILPNVPCIVKILNLLYHAFMYSILLLLSSSHIGSHRW